MTAPHQHAAAAARLSTLIQRRRPASRWGQWRLRRELRGMGRWEAAFVVITREDLRGVIQDLLTGEAEQDTIRRWAGQLAPLLAPFGHDLGRPVTAEGGYDWSIMAVLNALATKHGEAWWAMGRARAGSNE
jgi:hypothetical protein